MTSGSGNDKHHPQNGHPYRFYWLTAGLATIIAAIIAISLTHRSTGSGSNPGPTESTSYTPLSSTASSAGGSTGTQTSPGTVLLQKQGVQLTQGYQLSFIDPTLRPMSSNSGCPGGDLQICTNDGVISSAKLAVYPGRAGFSQCEADTAYVSAYANPNGQSLTGTTLCVTTGHRLAVCYVTSDTTQANTPAPGLIMDITVYAYA